MRRFSYLAVLALISISTLSGCATIGDNLNPFGQSSDEIPTTGDRNDNALNDTGGKESKARKALEAMASYQAALPPQPVNPVVRPAVVRMMWIPDHLNKNGDLVPAHYYYLKVKADQWALQDAFELEQQLGSNTDASALPYVVKGQK